MCPQGLCGPERCSTSKDLLQMMYLLSKTTIEEQENLRSLECWCSKSDETNKKTYIHYIHLSYIVIYTLYYVNNRSWIFPTKSKKTKMLWQNPLKWFQATFRDGWCGNRIETCQVFSKHSRAILWEIKVHTPIHALHEIMLKIHQLTYDSYDFDILMFFLPKFA